MAISTSEIKEAVIRSQHCQRNWNLSKKIDDKDLELIIYAVTNCPSKQNHAYYKVHAIINRKMIEEIHEITMGFGLPNGEFTTNSQTLANLLLVFEDVEVSDIRKIKNLKYQKGNLAIIERDKDLAIGVAAGYANLVSSLLGYNTGFCACFDNQKIKEILNSTKDVRLLLGIGFRNIDKDRRLHHLNDLLYPAMTKEKIPVNIIC
jgi:nitroreductase